MRRAGVSQIVRMRITGHRTDSMERRYNIVDVEDIRTAQQQMEVAILHRVAGPYDSQEWNESQGRSRREPE